MAKGTIVISYYVSCLSLKHNPLKHCIRLDWMIKYRQRYVLDVVFKEDDSGIMVEGGVENIVLFRRFVMNMMKRRLQGLGFLWLGIS